MIPDWVYSIIYGRLESTLPSSFETSPALSLPSTGMKSMAYFAMAVS